ncbi:MAG: VanZ family protein [Candidatus Andersenbacteria bacterium]
MKVLRWLAVGVWMVIIWWLSDQPDLRSGLAQDFFLRKVVHMVEFGVLTLLWYRALSPHTQALPAAVIIALLYAVLDEWHQSWVVGRHGVFSDVLIDSLGITITALIIRARHKQARRPVTSSS